MNLARYAVAQNAVNARFSVAVEAPFSRLRNTPRRRLLRAFPVSSLRQLLVRHSTLLVIDACAPRAEVSLWTAGSDSDASAGAPMARAVAACEGEASAALPVALAQMFAQPADGGHTLQNVGAVAFCDGPGSVLGVRLAAATLRTWRALRPDLALYSFHSLTLLAVSHPELTIIADARRDSWHTVRSGNPFDLARVVSAELAACGALGTPEGFRRWSALPAGIEPRALPWSAARLLAAASEAPFFAESPEPDAFLHEQPSYVAWTPQVHQAPVPSPATPRTSR